MCLYFDKRARKHYVYQFRHFFKLVHLSALKAAAAWSGDGQLLSEEYNP